MRAGDEYTVGHGRGISTEEARRFWHPSPPIIEQPFDTFPLDYDVGEPYLASTREAEAVVPKADGGGLRYDDGKIRMELLPFDALRSVAEVLTVGAKKYAPRNWERGMLWSKCVGCLMRHLVSRMMGERLDKESGLPHLAHVAVNALFLLTYELRGAGTDDLAPTPANDNRYDPIKGGQEI